VVVRGIGTQPGAQALVVMMCSVLHAVLVVGSWKHHTRHKATRSPGRVNPRPQHPRSVNGIQWKKSDIGRYRLLAKLTWLRTALDRMPRHPATPRRLAELLPPFADPEASLPNKSYTKTRISPQTR
jgi:hypothetical protein